MFSIIIPTYNNFDYLKLCIKSIKKNSKFNHEIIIFVQESNDKIIRYLNKQKIKYLYSNDNKGLCYAYNKCVKISKSNLIVTAHDDMYFCKKWDIYLFNEYKKLKTKKFYLSGTMIQAERGHYQLNCGSNPDNFNSKLLDNNEIFNIKNYQGSHWMPMLMHKETWNKAGGLSEEFFPGLGSDPDFNHKLWNNGVRIFKSIGKSNVYHFGSISSRKKEKFRNGSKLFLLKWKISVKFFMKYYLRSNEIYDGPLNNPNKNYSYYFELFLSKIYYLYLKIVNSYINKKYK